MNQPILDDRFHERGLHNFDDNLAQPRHRWYPFKEGFSAELVQQAISATTSTRGDRIRVLDPFCGSGTTAVTSALMGHRAVAIEVNPFCAFTARVKCMPHHWRKEPFFYRLDRITTAAKCDERQSSLENFSTFSERPENAKWLFNRSVLRRFDATWAASGRDGGGYIPAFRLAALRAAMECCNAKKDGKALRYKKKWKDIGYSGNDFIERFRSAALQFRDDTLIAPISTGKNVRIIQGDARKVLYQMSGPQFDLMVTSPPYLNSFDYSDVYRPELFLGKFVDSNESLRNVRLKTVRSHLQVKWGGRTEVQSTLLAPLIDELTSKPDLWNQRLPLMVKAYFHDMVRVLRRSAHLLRPGAQAWIVVSTSAYAGIHFPVDLILADLAAQVGFELDRIYVLRKLRAAGQQQKLMETEGLPLRESLIVLTRSKKPSIRGHIRP